MRRFLRHFVPFVAIQVLIAVVVVRAYQPNPRHIMASTIDKHRLLDTTPSPRLVLVGGSSVLFGIVSDTLAARFPYHPVNTSITAGLGAGFTLNDVRGSLRPGDVAVVSIEYEQFGITGTPEVVLRLLASRPASLQYVPLDYWPALLDYGVSYGGILTRGAFEHASGREEYVELPNVREALDRFGDDSLRTPVNKQPAIRVPVFAGGRLPRRFGAVMGELEDFAAEMRARGVRTYYMHPPVPATRWRLHHAQIALAESVFARRMPMPILDTPEQLVFPDSSFYDTEYHLTRSGAERRTQMLVRTLSARLAADTAGATRAPARLAPAR